MKWLSIALSLLGVGLALLLCAWPLVVLAMQQYSPPERPSYPAAVSASVTISATADFTPMGALYLSILPDLEEAPVATNAKPTEVYRGVQHGFSLPVWDADNEELFFNTVVPSFWAGDTDIIVHVDVSLDTANTDKNFNLVLDWEHWTPEYDVVPSSNTTVAVQTPTGTAGQYQSYRVSYTINYDQHGSGNEIKPGDIVAFRLRRLAASSDEAAGEVIVHRTAISYERGDFDDYLTGDVIAATYVGDSDVEELATEVAEQVDLVALGLQFAVVVILGALAFWRRHFFLYMLAGAAAMVWGIFFAAEGTDVYLGLGITTVVAGLFMLFRSAMILLGR